MLEYISLALGLGFLIFYLLSRRTAPAQPPAAKPAEQTHAAQQEAPVAWGRVRIYFGTQTGTAAKLAEQLAEEATEQGFEPEVIDLKDAKAHHFSATNEVSLFLLANTGEGDPPENTVRFLKTLRGKEELEDGAADWKRVNYSVFGLGNTQYEHFNKTGIDVDALLATHQARRVYKLGLGDDNCSLEDDFSEWRRELWKTVKEFRKANPLKEGHHEEKVNRKSSSDAQEPHAFLSKLEPLLANYRLFLMGKQHEERAWSEDDLDFKTKASLKAETAAVRSIRQLRQDTKDGSTLELEVELPGQPEYATAGNIALYSRNDPAIVREVVEYFQIPAEALGKPLGLLRVKEDKKIKLNFIPNTLERILDEAVDLQGRLTKSVLKKLSKFPSAGADYFSENSAKTTKEFERITGEQEWYTLVRVVREHQVQLALEDFLELCDSMAPRLFTIASHARAQRNVIVAASLTPNGLISKFFSTQPKELRAELRKSTFTELGKWKKVVMVGAGTGLAPFRGYIQEKEVSLREGRPAPILTLIFGCKHETGDFIYKEEIQEWHKRGVIDRLHLAFSRDSEKKVYVQDILAQQQEELQELGLCEDTAIYICGSLPMGKAIVDLLTHTHGAERVKAMEETGRIVKELW